jgi:putative transposase
MGNKHSMRNILGSRRSIRLAGYDYRKPGAYFVTICTYQRQLLFDNEALHDIASGTWQGLPFRFPTIRLDAFIIMPNHVHFILWLCDEVDSAEEEPTAGSVVAGIPNLNKPSLGDVVGVYKSLVATTYLRWVNDNDPSRSARVWQRGYYERIIRNEQELTHIRRYIQDNPRRWAEDRDNVVFLTRRMRLAPR